MRERNNEESYGGGLYLRLWRRICPLGGRLCLLLCKDLLPGALLLRQTGFRKGVRLAQLDGPDEETDDEAEAADSRVKDPQPAQAVREGLEDDDAGRLGESFDERAGGAGEGAGDCGCRFGACDGLDGGQLAREDVLVDDCAQDDGNGGGGLAEKGEGCGGGCHVGTVDVGLEGDEGGLEERADTYASDDLVHDDAGPGGVVFEVDEKAEAKGHEAQAADDQLAVAACLFDDDACACGDDGQAENQG